MPDSFHLDETFNPVAHALANVDNTFHPSLRSLFHYIATKISTLPEPKIRRLSDDELARLIEVEIKRLPDDEIKRLTEAEYVRFIGIADRVFRFLSAPTPKAAMESIRITPPLKNGATAIENFATEVFVDAFYTLAAPVFNIVGGFVLFFVGVCGALIIVGIGQVLVIFLPSPAPPPQYVTTHATQKERLRRLKKSNFLSKYSRTPDLKGLKGIGETYRREIYTDSRQEVEQDQEGTSRAVVSSSTSTSIYIS